MQLLSVGVRHPRGAAHGLASVHSDVDQSLLIVLAFLALLTLGLILAAYLEPGSRAKPLELRVPRGSAARRSARRR